MLKIWCIRNQFPPSSLLIYSIYELQNLWQLKCLIFLQPNILQTHLEIYNIYACSRLSRSHAVVLLATEMSHTKPARHPFFPESYRSFVSLSLGSWHCVMLLLLLLSLSLSFNVSQKIDNGSRSYSRNTTCSRDLQNKKRHR